MSGHLLVIVICAWGVALTGIHDLLQGGAR